MRWWQQEGSQQCCDGRRSRGICSLFGEREVPEARAILLTPARKHRMPIGMVDRDIFGSEDNGASVVNKGTQANEGVREGWHNMP